MSRSTRSSTRVRQDAPSPVVTVTPEALTSEIETISQLNLTFINSASEIQLLVANELDNMKDKSSLLMKIGGMKADFYTVVSLVTQLNNQRSQRSQLKQATAGWNRFMKNKSVILSLPSKKRRDFGQAGRDVAASLFMCGDVYGALSILRDVIDIVDFDPVAAVCLLRWLVRYSEWEAMESFIKEDKERKKSNFEGMEDIVAICEEINEFHRTPKGREAKAASLMQKLDELNNCGEKTFQIYESQILIYSTLSLVSKVAGIKLDKVLDPLFCLDNAFSKAETVVRSRWSSFWFDKKMDGMGLLMGVQSGYLRAATAIAEYYDILRMIVNEYTRCGILREPFQFASIALCNALRLGLPYWMSQSLSLLISTKSRSQAEQEEFSFIRELPHRIFNNETESKPAEVTCVTHIADKLNKISLFKDTPLHIPSLSSSSCDCHLCVEASANPSFAFLMGKMRVITGDHSLDSILVLMNNFPTYRANFASLQIKLMKQDKGKPRPPAWTADELCQSLVAFLLSPNGMMLGRRDQNRIGIMETVIKMCTYSNQVCLPYRLIVGMLARSSAALPPLPWMSKKSIMSKLGDLSDLTFGSERGDRRTPVRSPFTPLSNNTSGRITRSGKKTKEVNEGEEEKMEYENYSHLMFHDWRSRLCEDLCLRSEDGWRKAMFLSETVAVATRQARRLISGSIRPFGFTKIEQFKQVVGRMPKDMTVNQLIVTMSGDLYLVKVNSIREPIVVPLAKESKWSVMVDMFNRAMTKSDESAQAGKNMTDGKKFWEGRRKAEEMMRRAMVDMEGDLLGAFSPLLLPARRLTRSGEEIARGLMSKMEEGVNGELVRECVAVAAQIDTKKYTELVEVLGELEGWTRGTINGLMGLKKRMEKGDSVGWIEKKKEMPFVFFVLSTELSRIPWEAVTVLSNVAHSSRLVSIHQLFTLLDSFNKQCLDANPLNAFYILDPANDLEATKNRLRPVVEKYPWNGVIGKGPEKTEIPNIIREKDFFIFLGHGNGLKYLSRSYIRKSKCRPVVLLMGCSSVYTTPEGRGMDGKGAVLDYSVGSCPCIVGCIYLVTDGEIDKYFTEFLRYGFESHLEKGDSTPESELRLHLEAMSMARCKVKLPYLTGSTVVSYGIPITFRVK